MNRLQRIPSTLASLVMTSAVCAQWSFTVDPTFETQIIQQNVNDLAILENGNLLISGRIRFPGEMSDRGSARLMPSGMRDLTFPSFPQTTGGGKLTVWTEKFYVSNGLVRRLDGDGLLDASFISMNLGPYFSSLQGGDYHVYPDGRVLMSGRHMLSDSIRGFMGPHNLMWFSNTGYLDTTQTHRKGASCAVYRFKELPNGQFICSGTCTQFEGKEVDWIFRVNADGSPDTTFRTGVYIGEAIGYLPLIDGRVYVGGNFRRTQVPNDTLRLVRFLPDGELDPTFSIPQFTAGEGLNTPFGATVYTINPWINGTLIITGHFKRVNGELRKGICMIDTTGQLLPAFGGQGVGPFTFSGLTAASIHRITFNSDSTQMYICGAYNGYEDGLANYPEQRFITRLNVEEVGTGVVEQVPRVALHLWPNPTNGHVWLEYTLLGNPGTVQLRMRDAQGRVVHTKQASGEHGQIMWDTRILAPGVYTIELLREGKVERTERLVVQP